MNCPFYGRSGFVFPLLIDTLGNQCGLVVRSCSPCQMELNRQDPDWQSCRVIKEHTRAMPRSAGAAIQLPPAKAPAP
jgi:hypothetical protein